MSIYELYDLLKSAAIFKPENEYCISAIFRTGKFELFDYDAGILKVSIYLEHPKSNYSGVLSISTIDDGVWTAEFNTELNEELAKKIIEVFNSYGGVLPIEKVLNEDLSYIGGWGEFTG